MFFVFEKQRYTLLLLKIEINTTSSNTHFFIEKRIFLSSLELVYEHLYSTENKFINSIIKSSQGLIN